ncbi:MAG TPA: HDOD domain-containing protein [Rhodospirillales bacterium]|nr:HDOD domain-containing protein [Rhodospirillales bacterium]
MKSRILFVDDEAKVLQGLQRMLRGMRGEWVMAFAESGKEALELLAKTPADVVVSDMRMPGMDGAQLLDTVRRRHPGATRIILSGYANEESVLRTIGPAHQYLAKPCDSETLTRKIINSLELRRLLKTESLRHLVSSLDPLPTTPKVYFELLEELNSPTASVNSVAEIFSHDVGMTAHILKLTNTAFFALPMKATTARDAVQLLGFDTTRALVLMTGFFSRFKGDANATPVLERLSRRSFAIGVLAKAIAEKEGLGKLTADQACCAGALSHVGTLLLIANLPAEFKQAVAMVEDKGIAIIEAERRVFGAGHAEFGAYLLGLWGFTDTIIEAVAYHHQPGLCCSRKVGVLTVLHAAQDLIRGREDTHKIEEIEEMPGAALDRQYLAEAGVADRLPAWLKIFHDLKKTDQNK